MPLLKKIIKLVSINLLVLLVLLAVVEVIFRILGYGYNNSPADPDAHLHHVHPKNYLYKSYTPVGEYGDFMVYYDSLGRRSQVPEKIPTTSSNTRTVAFLGDSFVEALQVSYDSSFIGLLAKKFPGTSFLNYGVSGYSPLLSYLQCQKMLNDHKVRPDAVFLVLFSNDVRDDSVYMRRAVYTEPGHEFSHFPGRKPSWFKSFGRKLYLARMIRKAIAYWDYQQQNQSLQLLQGVVVNGLLEESRGISNTLTANYILKMDSLLKEYKIPLYLAAIPSRYENFTGDTNFVSFSERAQSWAQTSGLQYISFDSAFTAATTRREKLFFNIDVHCNASGHRAMASVLEQWIR